MGVRPGYKQTEVGVIPVEWGVSPLERGLSRSPTYGINAPAVPFSDRFPAYIRITDITEDSRFNPEIPVSVNARNADSYYLEDGDIVFARTGASVGKSYRYRPKDGKLVYAGFLIRIHPDEKILHAPYVAAFVQTNAYWRWVNLMSMRSGQPGINGAEYAQMPIPIPSIKEQHAIATALANVDALVESLDKLIAKKRDIKQAAMQSLLTGKTRLPGFKREWKEKRLGDGCTIITKGTTPTSIGKYFTESGVTFLKIEALNDNGKFIKDQFAFIDTETHRLLKRSQLQKGDLLISIAGALGRTGIVPKSVLPANTNQALAIVRLSPESDLDGMFLYYSIKAERIQKHFRAISVQGAASKSFFKADIGYPN